MGGESGRNKRRTDSDGVESQRVTSLSPRLALSQQQLYPAKFTRKQPPSDAQDNQKSESERYLFDPHKKLIQSNNEKQLGSGDPY